MADLNPAELAEAIEGANSLLLRWGHNQMRQLKASEVERIVAAMKASASSETETPKDERERLQFPFGFGDILDVSHYKDEVHFEIDEPYAGDTESGIGRNSSATIGKDNAIELARWILSRLSERPREDKPTPLDWYADPRADE